MRATTMNLVKKYLEMFSEIAEMKEYIDNTKEDLKDIHHDSIVAVSSFSSWKFCARKVLRCITWWIPWMNTVYGLEDFSGKKLENTTEEELDLDVEDEANTTEMPRIRKMMDMSVPASFICCSHQKMNHWDFWTTIDVSELAHFKKDAKKIEVTQIIDEDAWPKSCYHANGNRRIPTKTEMDQAGREWNFNVNDLLSDRFAR